MVTIHPHATRRGDYTLVSASRVGSGAVVSLVAGSIKTVVQPYSELASAELVYPASALPPTPDPALALALVHTHTHACRLGHSGTRRA